MKKCFLSALFAFFVLASSASALTVDGVVIVEPASGGAVLKYGKLEAVITLGSVAASQFYEPNPAYGGLNLRATFISPAGTNITVNGYYDGASWRVRFSPTLEGAWTFSVSATDSGGNAAAAGGAFTCVTSAYPGFAKISGRYLAFTNGKNFYAIGHNNGWQYDVEQPSLSTMSVQGENLLSFWLAAPWIIPSDNIPRAPIENAVDGIGHYNQASCTYLDGVVARAEAAGVYLLPSIWAHDQLCGSGIPAGWPSSWSNNAYSTVCAAGDFFTTGSSIDTTQWRLQKNYYRYLLARWGYSRAIAGWVSVVEVDGTTGYVQNAAQVTAWAGKLAAFFSANDPYRTAATYPLAMTRVDVPTFDVGLGMRATDSYSSKTSNSAVAQTLATQATTMRASGKPGFHAEFGGDVLNGASQPAHLHNGTWGALAGGSALSPLLWCDGGNYPMMTDANVGTAMQAHLTCLSQFMNGITCQGDPTLTAATLSLSGSALRGWGMRTTTKAFGWVQNSQGGSINGQTLTVSGLTAGKYNIAFYNVWQSGSTPILTRTSITVKSNGQFAAALPVVSNSDVAWSLFPTP